MRTKILVLGLFCLSMFGCFGEEKPPPPQVTAQEKKMAIDMIKGYEEVTDAAISQKNETLSLVVFVEYGTSKEKAKEMGDNFVRLVKTFTKDISPEKEIGEGIYDYIIGVYYPNQKEIVIGAKSTIGRNITW